MELIEELKLDQHLPVQRRVDSGITLEDGIEVTMQFDSSIAMDLTLLPIERNRPVAGVANRFSPLQDRSIANWCWD